MLAGLLSRPNPATGKQATSPQREVSEVPHNRSRGIVEGRCDVVVVVFVAVVTFSTTAELNVSRFLHSLAVYLFVVLW